MYETVQMEGGEVHWLTEQQDESDPENADNQPWEVEYVHYCNDWEGYADVM